MECANAHARLTYSKNNVLCKLRFRMAKGKLDLEVSEIGSSGEMSCANVHGRVVELSPIKKSRYNDEVEYFEGQITDGKEMRRMVCFHPKIWKEIKEMKEKGESVTLLNCNIKKAKIGDQYELVASGKCSVVSSPKRKEVSKDILDSCTGGEYELSLLSEIGEIKAFVGNKVSIKGKVSSVEAAVKIESRGRELQKQECLMCDSSGCYRLILWESLVGKVQCSQSYRINKVAIKAYNGRKYFSTLEETTVGEIYDIGDVSNEKRNDTEQFFGSIIGVVSCTEFLSCFSCNAKVTEKKAGIGTCNKCGVSQKMMRCKKNIAAKVVVEGANKVKKNVSLFTDVINSLIVDEDEEDEEEDDVEIRLLNVSSKIFVLNRQNVAIRIEDNGLFVN